MCFFGRVFGASIAINLRLTYSMVLSGDPWENSFYSLGTLALGSGHFGGEIIRYCWFHGEKALFLRDGKVLSLFFK